MNLRLYIAVITLLTSSGAMADSSHAFLLSKIGAPGSGVLDLYVTTPGSGNIYGNGKMQAIADINYVLDESYEVKSFKLKDYDTLGDVENSGWFYTDEENTYLHDISSRTSRYASTMNKATTKKRLYLSTLIPSDIIRVCAEITVVNSLTGVEYTKDSCEEGINHNSIMLKSNLPIYLSTEELLLTSKEENFSFGQSIPEDEIHEEWEKGCVNEPTCIDRAFSAQLYLKTNSTPLISEANYSNLHVEQGINYTTTDSAALIANPAPKSPTMLNWLTTVFIDVNTTKKLSAISLFMPSEPSIRRQYELSVKPVNGYKYIGTFFTLEYRGQDADYNGGDSYVVQHGADTCMTDLSEADCYRPDGTHYTSAHSDIANVESVYEREIRLIDVYGTTSSFTLGFDGNILGWNPVNVKLM